MYPNFRNFSSYQNFRRPNYQNGDRFIGGFAFPFLLGGVTGAAIAPAFYRPNYGPAPYPVPYPVPYPYYGPYYR